MSISLHTICHQAVSLSPHWLHSCYLPYLECTPPACHIPPTRGPLLPWFILWPSPAIHSSTSWILPFLNSCFHHNHPGNRLSPTQGLFTGEIPETQQDDVVSVRLYNKCVWGGGQSCSHRPLSLLHETWKREKEKQLFPIYKNKIIFLQ